MSARLVIIEDNPVSLQLAKHLLQDGGYTVLTAENPARGMALIRQQRPDLVICDLQLPAMNGYELLQSLRQDPAYSQIAVLAVTAFSAPGDAERALAAGFCGYIRKPILPKDFVRQIEAHLAPELRAQSTHSSKPAHRYGQSPRRRR
jgi:two-component system, cell cycle response regulator DivK